jgi:hypothetical protein
MQIQIIKEEQGKNIKEEKLEKIENKLYCLIICLNH